MTTNTNNKINIKSTISSTNKDLKKTKEIKDMKEPDVIFSNDEPISSDDEPILKKKKSTTKHNISPRHTEPKQETIHRNLDITKLAYEKINDKYSKAKYGEFDVIMDMTTGYINATKLCTDGGKQLKNWTRNEGNKELIEYFENSHRLEFEPMTKIVTGGQNTDLRGTYVHPKLITHIASWVSPAFAWKVSEIVNNHLIREKEIEITRLTGKNTDLIKMFEDERKRRMESDKENKQLLLDMKLQNEKTHSKLDKTHTKLDKTKDILKRVETRVEKIVEEVVPPAKQVSLHEQFGIMKLNDSDGKRHYKVYCCQTRAVNKAKDSILKTYPKACVFREVKPSPNSKNFLHQIKENYGSGKKSKIKISYNFINLNHGVTEVELNNMLDEVIESNKNYGN